MQLLRGRTKRVDQLAISTDGRYLMVGDWSCHVWNLHKSQARPVTVIKGGLNNWVFDVQFLNPTQLLFHTSYPIRMRRHDIESGETVELTHDGGVLCDRVGIHPRGKTIQSRVWLTTNVYELRSYHVLDDGLNLIDMGTPRPRIDSLSGFSPTGDHYLAEANLTGDRARTHHLYESATDVHIATFERPHFPGTYFTNVHKWCFSPDGRRLFFADGGRLERYDCVTGGLPTDTLTLSSDANPSPPIAAHPDGRLLATVEDGRAVTFRDAESLEVLRSYDFAMPTVTCVAFTPDGTRCVIGNSRGKVLLFDVE